MTRTLLQSLATIAAVVASAKLASVMIVSELVLSPVWLPAAICLVALIWLGNRGIPAIVLSTGFLGLVVARDAGIGPALTAVVIAGTAAGATLQAMVGRYLIERFIGGDCAIDSARQFARLLCIAPVAGAISPSIGVTTQFLCGVWPEDSFLLYWSNWWLGNITAVALLTPLLLGLRRGSLSQSLLVCAFVIVGFLFSYQLGTSEADRANKTWISQARHMATQLTSTFVHNLQLGYGDIRAVELLLEESLALEEDSFQAAIATLKGNREGFAPASLLVTRRDEQGNWPIVHISENNLGLEPGFHLNTIPVALDAIESALSHGLTLGATAPLGDGIYYGFNTLPVNSAKVPTVVMGIQDVNEVDRLVAAETPEGLGFAISSVHPKWPSH